MFRIGQPARRRAEERCLAACLAIIHEHARRSGFPANKVTEIRQMIDPTTATEA